MGNHVYQYKKRSDTNTMSDLRKYYGGDEGIRTPGLCLAKAALSQLSHIPGRSKNVQPISVSAGRRIGASNSIRHAERSFHGSAFLGQSFRPESMQTTCLF